MASNRTGESYRRATQLPMVSINEASAAMQGHGIEEAAEEADAGYGGAAKARAPASTSLLIFARLPVAGKVKTRLAATAGDGAAAVLYARMLEHTLVEGARVTALTRKALMVADASEVGAMRKFVASLRGGALAREYEVVAQHQADGLGPRLSHAFEDAFACGEADGSNEPAAKAANVPVVVAIGSDAPGLTADTINAAVAAVRGIEHPPGFDACIGPAADGGYYLLALGGRSVPQAFEDIPWSTSEVRARTEAALAAVGASVAPSTTLPMLVDVDDEASLGEWAAGAPKDHWLLDRIDVCAARAKAEAERA